MTGDADTGTQAGPHRPRVPGAGAHPDGQPDAPADHDAQQGSGDVRADRDSGCSSHPLGVAMFFFISLYLQQALGLDPLHAGLAYLPLALTIVVTAGAGSAVVSRLGFKPVLMGGLACIALGLAWFSQITPDGSFLTDVLGPSLVVGAGLGLSFVSVTIAAVIGTEASEAGLASGLINTSQQIGGALGLAILATIATSVATRADTPDPVTALTEGFQVAFLVGAGVAALAFVLAAVTISSADSKAVADGRVTVVAAG